MSGINSGPNQQAANWRYDVPNGDVSRASYPGDVQVDGELSTPPVGGGSPVALNSDAGATAIGTTSGDNVQEELNARPSSADLAGAGGSALIGFTQSGAGASLRTVQAKLRETLSVLDFGAIGDGVTNDTAAFALARDAAGPYGQIVVPKGTYQINDLSLNVEGQTWCLKKGATIRGINPVTSDTFVIGAENITIDGGTFDNGALGVGIDRCCIRVLSNGFKITSNSKVGGAKGPCIGIYDADDWTIEADFFNTWYAAVFAQPLTRNMKNGKISGNIVNKVSVGTDYKYGFNVHSSPDDTLGIENVVITGGTIEFPPAVSGEFPILVEVYGGLTNQFRLKNVSVTGVTALGGAMGFSFANVDTGSFSGLSSKGAFLYGIEIARSKNVSLGALSVLGGQRGIAINDLQGENISLAGASISDTTQACIHVSFVETDITILGAACNPLSGDAIYLLRCKNWSISGGSLNGRNLANKAIVLDKSDEGTIIGVAGKDFLQNGVLFIANNAVAYNRVTVANCVWTNVLNSLNITLQLSGGATVGRQFRYMNNSSSTDTSYMRNILDVANNVVDIMGAGSPEGAFSGSRGSIFRRNDGGAGTSFYVKESGTGNTGWVAK